MMKLLIIDEELTLYDQIKNAGWVKKCLVFFSRDIQEILQFIDKEKLDAVIIDIDRYKKKSLRLLGNLKSFDALIDVILVGEEKSPEEVSAYIRKGASHFIPKPAGSKDFHKAFQAISERRALRKETFRLEKQLEKKYSYMGMVGKSPYMLEIFSLIEKTAPYFSTILITGETGTGKELVAHAIHKLSPESGKPLVICDCVSIPENLFESELFGYSKGAFTGADQNKQGLFDEADGGIIFLDEIGEIPLSIQPKLLRVLENHQFRPLGANQPKKVNVKVIAATNRDLEACVKSGVFRKDLYHRLNKAELVLPPLRERKEDITLLSRFFVKNLREKFDKKIKGISRQVQKLFMKYSWPGNVRELQNVLERAAMVTKKNFIDVEDLPAYLRDSIDTPRHIPFMNRSNLSSMEELEKEYIQYILKITRHNMKQTAEILKISRTTLYNKTEKYGIH
ncbi:MAG: sigma-54 dependent transcriptional regulator [Candidatus Aminicenantes bacterium]